MMIFVEDSELGAIPFNSGSATSPEKYWLLIELLYASTYHILSILRPRC